VTVKERSETRSRILHAAEVHAREVGPGRLSLEAVAARAGVSKGGLLYHFPSKARLMEALVEHSLGRVDAAMAAEESRGRPNGAIAAYMDAVTRECCRDEAPPSGLLAALAEDPGLLDPVRDWERDFFDRIRANATDPALATLAFLAVHGVRSMALLNVRVLEPAEIEAALADLRTRLGVIEEEPA
jgi:AcrR family transcriptional regulator